MIADSTERTGEIVPRNFNTGSLFGGAGGRAVESVEAGQHWEYAREGELTLEGFLVQHGDILGMP